MGGCIERGGGWVEVGQLLVTDGGPVAPGKKYNFCFRQIFQF